MLIFFFKLLVYKFIITHLIKKKMNTSHVNVKKNDTSYEAHSSIRGRKVYKKKRSLKYDLVGRIIDFDVGVERLDRKSVV